ncbi:MAG: O-antigen ligase family protein [Planctomycetota bacterium]
MNRRIPMMNRKRITRRLRQSYAHAADAMHWGGGMVLALLPGLLALDFGGVLPWTQWLLSACLLTILSSILVTGLGTDQGHRWQFWIAPTMLLCLAIYAWVQTIPLDGGLVKTLSGGSFNAYREWILPFVGQDALPDRFPVSVAADQTRTATAMIWLALAAMVISIQITSRRDVLRLILWTLSITGAAYALFGIGRLIEPEWALWGYAPSATAFGSFVNRNAGGLFLNLCLACSLGLLAWRLSVIQQFEMDDQSFEWDDLLSIVSDPGSMIGLVGSLFTIVGLVFCGSRGGLASMLVGIVFALGWAHRRRGLRAYLGVGAIACLSAVVMLLPAGIEPQSLLRLQDTVQEEGVVNSLEGRWNHWQDGFEAAVGYFPAGSGAGTYAEAHLPWADPQSLTWFRNADNLWLEILVESGLPGVLLVLAMIALSARCLWRLRSSADPIDIAARVAGWHALPVVLLSQTFGFGLKTPANFVLVAMLGGLVWVRAQKLRVSASRMGTGVQFRNFRSAIPMLLASVVIVSLGVLAERQLRFDAHVEAVAQIQLTPQSADSDWQQLRGRIENLQAWGPPTGKLLERETTLALARDTKRMVDASDADQLPEVVESLLGDGRMFAAAENGRPSLPASDAGADSLIHNREHFLLRPLGFETRRASILASRIHRNPDLTARAVDQLKQFFGGNFLLLRQLGLWTAAVGLDEAAGPLLRQSCEKSPRHQYQVLQVLDRFPELAVSQCLPKDAAAYERAAPWMIRRLRGNGGDMAAPNQMSFEFAEQVRKEILNQPVSQRKSVQARRFALAAEFSAALGRIDEAAQTMEDSLELAPQELKHRLRLIQWLRELQRYRDALNLARTGRDYDDDSGTLERVENEIRFEAKNQVPD